MADKQNSINYFGLEDWWERIAGGKPQTGFVDRYIDRDADGGDNQSLASP